MSTQIHNRPELLVVRRLLRQDQTSVERAMWSLVRNSRILGRKFKRQHSIGKYVVDFYCASERLIVELDGAHHFTQAGSAADHERDKFMENLKFKVLRFENKLFRKRPDAVLYKIIQSFENKADIEAGEKGLDKAVDSIMEDWSRALNKKLKL